MPVVIQVSTALSFEAVLTEILNRKPPTYLKSYDLEARDGFGYFTFTNDRDKALRFADTVAAMAAWQSSPKCHPIREADGKPNRPMTQFTIKFETVDS